MQPRGLQIGATTDVIVTGTGLDDSLRLITPLGGSLHMRVGSVEGDRCRLHITLDHDVQPGIYPLRLANEGGLSSAISIGVDRLPQVQFGAAIESLPVAMYGRLAGPQVLQTHFDGHAGQRLVVDVEAQRLGSKLRPTLRLFSPAGRLINIAQPKHQLGGDARLDLTLPAAGQYRLELQDIVYDAGDANWFRLKLGDLRYADGVFPLAVSGASDEAVSLVATNLEGAVTFLPALPGARVLPVRVRPDAASALLTGAMPCVHLSPREVNELTEDVARHRPDRLRAPLGINGRLSAPTEQDEYDVQVEPGKKLTLEIHAARWGSPLDAVLVVQKPDGQALAEADDQGGSVDPRIDLDVPPDVSSLRIKVLSRVGQGGDAFVYRLSVGPSRGPHPTIEADLDSLNLPSGDVVVLPLRIDHGGQPRALQLALPPALEHVVTVFPQQLDATDEVGLISLTAAPHARGVFRGWLQAVSADGLTTEPVWLQSGRFPGSDYQPQWREDLMMAVTSPGPLGLAWSNRAEPAYLARGTTRQVGVQIQRRGGAVGPVRLSLVSSQRPPEKQVNGQTQPDEARTFRLAEPVVVPAAEDDGRLRLVTPKDLPLHAWSFAIKAELLGADEKQILAIAFTPLRRWEAIEPLKITWDAKTPLSVTAGDLSGRVVHGRIERHRDFDFPVKVQVQGLAETETPPPVTVPAGETGFDIRLVFATDSPARDVNDVRLLAVPLEPTDANRDVSSQTDAVQLQVTTAASP
jgi:hypothetical protein